VTWRAVTAAQFGNFLIGIFDRSVKNDVGTVFVMTVDVALGSWLSQSNLGIVTPTCGNALVLECNGDAYPCEYFMGPEYPLRNFDEDTVQLSVASEKVESVWAVLTARGG
jgi:uncharacterized protein